MSLWLRIWLLVLTGSVVFALGDRIADGKDVNKSLLERATPLGTMEGEPDAQFIWSCGNWSSFTEIPHSGPDTHYFWLASDTILYFMHVPQPVSDAEKKDMIVRLRMAPMGAGFGGSSPAPDPVSSSGVPPDPKASGADINLLPRDYAPGYFVAFTFDVRT